MYIIKNNNKNEITIKNSKFITYSFYIETEDNINIILKDIKKRYKDSTHIVYAYRTINNEKAYDDNEPSGTAGLPILEVIKKNDLINVLIITIRYFGGIKLGAGGLIRAYSKSCREILKISNISKYIKYNYYVLNTNYDNLKLLNNLTNNLKIISKEFNENVEYKIKIENDKDNINNIFKNTNINIKKL